MYSLYRYACREGVQCSKENVIIDSSSFHFVRSLRNRPAAPARQRVPAASGPPPGTARADDGPAIRPGLARQATLSSVSRSLSLSSSCGPRASRPAGRGKRHLGCDLRRDTRDSLENAATHLFCGHTAEITARKESVISAEITARKDRCYSQVAHATTTKQQH